MLFFLDIAAFFTVIAAWFAIVVTALILAGIALACDDVWGLAAAAALAHAP